MIGKIIGAFVGDRVAKHSSSVGGATGAAMGVLASTALRRLSLPAIVVLGAGGYLAKKYLDKQDAKNPDDKKTEEQPPVTSTAPAAA